MKRRSRGYLLLALVGVTLLALAGRYGYWVLVEHRFQTITEGKVYKSSAMPPDELVRRVEALGIRTVIDLRNEAPESSAAERAAVEKAGLRYVNLPSEQVPDSATVDAYLALMKRPEIFPVLIHCEHGVGRSVLFAALYRIEFEGWDSERARCATTYFPWRGSFRPGSDKGDYVRNYKPRSR